MKKAILFIVLALIASPAFSCNVCGGSSNNQSLGLLPLSDKHFIGLQTQYRTYISRHENHEAPEKEPVPSTETYGSIQAFGKYSLSSSWHLYAFVPYHINSLRHGNRSDRVHGIGDIAILTSYQFISKEDCGPILKHNLQIGAGIKAPTGTYSPSTNKEVNTASLQPGSNSWDFMGNANYSMRKDKVGVHLEASYMVTTPNAGSYKYGNRFNAALLAFHSFEKINRTLLPIAGFRFEVTGRDYDNYKKGWINHSTGGNLIYGSLGLQSFFNDFGIMASFSVPLMQHLAGGAVKANYKVDAGFQYLFKRN